MNKEQYTQLLNKAVEEWNKQGEANRQIDTLFNILLECYKSKSKKKHDNIEPLKHYIQELYFEMGFICGICALSDEMVIDEVVKHIENRLVNINFEVLISGINT